MLKNHLNEILFFAFTFLLILISFSFLNEKLALAILFSFYVVVSCYFTLSFSTKKDLVDILKIVLLFGILTYTPIIFLFTDSGITDLRYVFMLFVLVAITFLLPSFIFYFILRRIKIPNSLAVYSKYFSLRNLFVVEVTVVVLFLLFNNFVEIVIIKSVPIETYASYISLKSRYNCEDECIASIELCKEERAENYFYVVSGGLPPLSTHEHYFNKRGNKLDYSNYPILESCKLIFGDTPWIKSSQNYLNRDRIRELINKAIQTKNITICNEINIEYFRSACYNQLAVMLKDKTFCRKIEDRLYGCSSGPGWFPEPFCNISMEFATDTFGTCIAKVFDYSESKCQKIYETKERDQCFVTIYKHTNITETSFCSKISELNKADTCRVEAIKNSCMKNMNCSFDLCSLIINEVDKDLCLGNVAQLLCISDIKNCDPHICDNMNEFRAYCYEDLLKLKCENNSNFCNPRICNGYNFEFDYELEECKNSQLNFLCENYADLCDPSLCSDFAEKERCLTSVLFSSCNQSHNRCNVDFCNRFEEKSYKKDLCFLLVARKEGNSGLCNSIYYESSRNMCKREFGK